MLLDNPIYFLFYIHTEQADTHIVLDLDFTPLILKLIGIFNKMFLSLLDLLDIE